jgi:hypothetical protein
MTTFPLSPRTLRGAIIALGALGRLAEVIAFQYNPEKLTRRLTPQAASEGGARSEAMRLKGPPQEEIDATVEIDAADQLGAGDPLAGALGIHPQLAALELLLYPASATVIANAILSRVGVIEVVPPEAPLTLFVWGPRRVLPVRLTSLSVEEQMHDPRLNPIRASVSLSLRVLSYHDLPQSSPGYGLSLAHQIGQEVLAALAVGTSLRDLGVARLR